jgi:hypothetical protein
MRARKTCPHIPLWRRRSQLGKSFRALSGEVDTGSPLGKRVKTKKGYKAAGLDASLCASYSWRNVKSTARTKEICRARSETDPG